MDGDVYLHCCSPQEDVEFRLRATTMPALATEKEQPVPNEREAGLGRAECHIRSFCGMRKS